MNITIITLFPDMFTGPFSQSIIKKATDRAIASISFINIRDFSTDRYKTVDDKPYGGGHGMILKVDVVDRAIQHARTLYDGMQSHVVLLDPKGTPYTQQIAQKFTSYSHLILLCGHYEGVDERIRGLVDSELSIGDYILTGGEIAAMAVCDSVIRLLPGALKHDESSAQETFSIQGSLLEFPQYTRPETYQGITVPEVLLSGDHKRIDAWRREQSKHLTRMRRPDLTDASGAIED